KTIAFIIGAVIGASLAYVIAIKIGPWLKDYLSLELCIIIAVVLGAIVGGYLGMAFLKGMIAMFMGFIGYSIGTLIFGDESFIPIVVGIVVFVIIWLLIDKFLSIITAIFGACLVGMAVSNLVLIYFPDLTLVAFIVFIVCAIVLAAIGARFQLDQT
ncbi:MAG: hypothetical protein KAJ51_00530, partial [Thermoplasmata archaeon]|nr:hypothetical protein [Thermoplasmata archaeon]